MVPNRFIHACAGAGKTELIVRRCADLSHPARRLVITLTQSGQEELANRLSEACSASTMPDVMGWYSFLIAHYVKPYLPRLFSNIRPVGFIFDLPSHPDNLLRLSGERRYFSKDRYIYKETLPELAIKVSEAAQGQVEDRLSRIYDEIIIDEAQDISRKSLDIITRLLTGGGPSLLLVGDVRQSLLDSDLRSSKNKSADRLGLLRWYQEHEVANRLVISHLEITHRSNQNIAEFSDRIFPPELGFAKTQSVNTKDTGHDGVFYVREEHLDIYFGKFSPVPLRVSSASGKKLSRLKFRNIGAVKGLSFDRVAIYPTKAMLDLISRGVWLRDKSACQFYVGVTRARNSVSLIVDSRTADEWDRLNLFLPIQPWTPELEKDQYKEMTLF